MTISEWPVAPCIVSTSRTSVPALGRDVDDERGVRRLRELGVVLGARDEDREAAPRRALRDEPLVAVDDPLVAVLVRRASDERRVGAGDLGLGHREAGHRDAVAERPEVLLLLLVGPPVQQRVHVALVGRLAVEDERAVVRLRRLGLHHRELDVAEAHAAPLLRHVRQPQPDLREPARGASGGSRCSRRASSTTPSSSKPSSGRLDDVVDEGPDPSADLLELGCEGEVDGHAVLPGRTPPPYRSFVRCHATDALIQASA